MKKLALLAALFCQPAYAAIDNPPGVLQFGPVVGGDCVEWVGNNVVQDAGTVCGGSGAGVPGGANNSVQYNNGGLFGGFTIGGDCTLVVATGAITCTMTGGVPFAASATTDTTVASNITSGTLPAARLPNPGAASLGGIKSLAIVAHKYLTDITTAGLPEAAQPNCGDLSDVAASCATDTTVATNIASGTLNTARLPSPFTSGTISGNTSVFATTKGTLTSGNCAKFDVDGNVIAAGAACGTGTGTVNSGTAGQLGYYSGTGTAISGNANATISNGALTLGVATSAQGSLKLSGSTSGTTTLAAPVSGGGTMTLQAGSDTLVGQATSDTLTNKTLVLPVIASISNSGTVTIPTGANTLVARTTTDTLTNKTISGSSNTLTNIAASSLATVQGNGSSVQLSTGATTTNHCVKYDANGNTVDAGASCASPVSPGGADTNIQFNDSSAFGGSSGFTFNKTSKKVTLTNGYTSVIGDGVNTSIQVQPAAGLDAFGIFDSGANKQIFSVDSYGHVYTSVQAAVNTPTIAAGPGAGTSPTISITGSDVNGVINLTSGTSTAASPSSIVFTATFGTAYGATPKTVIIMPANQPASQLSNLGALYLSAISTTAWSVTRGPDNGSGGTLIQALTSYKWYYFVIG